MIHDAYALNLLSSSNEELVKVFPAPFFVWILAMVVIRVFLYFVRMDFRLLGNSPAMAPSPSLG